MEFLIEKTFAIFDRFSVKVQTEGYVILNERLFKK